MYVRAHWGLRNLEVRAWLEAALPLTVCPQVTNRTSDASNQQYGLWEVA